VKHRVVRDLSWSERG